ncbi:MAG: SDR family oxidoreductase [Planctomycetia bacterium]|nr:SDR family oxidoreductase [Planctomycetia bacterium]
MKFEGRSALVTGASMGIGAAAAIELARQGANVAINFRSHRDKAEAVKGEIEKLGRKAILLQADVSDQKAVEEMVAETVRTFGGLNHFVSNAVYSDRQLMIEADMAGFRRTIDVSMWGAFYGLRASSQQMVKQGKGGSIAIVSSPHAVIPIPTSMAYNMAKAAIDHMGRTAAIELVNHKIRVNIFHPGWIDTPGERKFFSEEQLKVGGQKLPWGRMGTPEEMARGLAFILSDDCDYMTGSTFSMEGGVSLPWWSNRGSGEM